MSLTPKDLENLFRELGMAMPSPMEMGQIVGGKVIAGLPPETKNARDMTRLLAGGGLASNGNGYAKTFADSLGKGPLGTDATGSKSKPFTVELTQTTVQNLANKIGKEKGKPSLLEKMLGAFQKGSDASKPYQPLTALKDIVLEHFGLKKAAAPTEKPAPNAVLDAAKRNAEKLARFARPGYKLPEGPHGLDPFGGGMQTRIDEALAGKARGKKVQDLDKFAAQGMGSNKGFTETIAGPPAASTLAAVGEGAEGGLMGLAAAASEAAGAFVPVAGQVALIGGVLYKAAMAAEAWADGVMQGNRELVKWDGQLAVAAAKTQIGDIKRQAEMARMTGGSASALEEQQNALKDEAQPFSEGLQNIKNDLAIVVTLIERGLVFFVKFGTIIGPILDFINWMQGNKKAETPMAQLFDFFEHNARLENARSKHHAVHGARAVRPGERASGGALGPGGAAPASARSSRASASANIGGNRGIGPREKPAGAPATNNDAVPEGW